MCRIHPASIAGGRLCMIVNMSKWSAFHLNWVANFDVHGRDVVFGWDR